MVKNCSMRVPENEVVGLFQAVCRWARAEVDRKRAYALAQRLSEPRNRRRTSPKMIKRRDRSNEKDENRDAEDKEGGVAEGAVEESVEEVVESADSPVEDSHEVTISQSGGAVEEHRSSSRKRRIPGRRCASLSAAPYSSSDSPS